MYHRGPRRPGLEKDTKDVEKKTMFIYIFTYLYIYICIYIHRYPTDPQWGQPGGTWRRAGGA